MKKHLISILVALCGTAASAADLSDAEKTKAQELAKANGCLSCHASHEKVIGPAYASIAAKYKNEPDAAASLVQSIQNGSQGKWGRAAMPRHSSISQEDLTLLARWVLATPK